MNIFISFSGVTRDIYAIKFMDFFNKYGLKCWYDQHELFLGDDLKHTIIQNGINTADYCILIINKTYLRKNWPCEEAKRLYENLKARKDFAIFPILLDITKEEIKASELDFLLNIKYQFLHGEEDIIPIGFQILNRIFHDITLKHKLKTINDALDFFKRLTFSSSIDIYNALNVVNHFVDTNYKDKTIILTCLTNLFNNIPYRKTLNQISYSVYDNQQITYDMYKIVESIFLITASMFII